MPPFSPRTVIQPKTQPLFSTLVLNDHFYYNSTVMNEIFDFNITFEFLGSNTGIPYHPQKLWIVSKKIMEIFLKEFGQNKRDFIPVILADECCQ